MRLSRFNHLFTTVKPTIFKQAVELGATCTPAFTDRVTHLVASGHGGAKYMVS
jgi:DNA replication regulator DPB11